MVRGEKDAAAINAAGEANADGLRWRNGIQPLRDLRNQRGDVLFPNHIEVRRESVRLRIKKARVHRIRIRTADQLQLYDVVRRHHPRITRMKLTVETFSLQ